MTTRTFLSIIACKRLLSRGDEEKAKMNNRGWWGEVEEDCLHPTLFRWRFFTNIGRSAKISKDIAPEEKVPVVWDSLFLWQVRNNGFQVYKNFKYFRNQLKYDKTSRIKSNPSERKWRFSLLTSMYSNMEKWGQSDDVKVSASTYPGNAVPKEYKGYKLLQFSINCIFNKCSCKTSE